MSARSISPTEAKRLIAQHAKRYKKSPKICELAAHDKGLVTREGRVQVCGQRYFLIQQDRQ